MVGKEFYIQLLIHSLWWLLPLIVVTLGLAYVEWKCDDEWEEEDE